MKLNSRCNNMEVNFGVRTMGNSSSGDAIVRETLHLLQKFGIGGMSSLKNSEPAEQGSEHTYEYEAHPKSLSRPMKNVLLFARSLHSHLSALVPGYWETKPMIGMSPKT